jgi:hypothetical protein
MNSLERVDGPQRKELVSTEGSQRFLASSRAVCAAIALSALACSKSQPAASPKAEAGPPSESAHASQEPESLPPPPLQVAAPPGIVFRARLTQPALVADRVLEAAGLPFRAADFLNDLDDEPNTELGLPFSELDLNGSFETLIALDPAGALDAAPEVVVSASVRSLKGALEALHRGRIDLMEGPGGSHYFSKGDAHCVLGRALGPTPYRVACSSDPETLTSLMSYALAGLPAEERGPGLGWFELDFGPLRQKFGSRARGLKLLASVGSRQLHLDHPRFDRAITEAAVSLAEEAGDLLNDVDLWRGEFDQTERGDIRLKLSADFGHQTSWTALALKDLTRGADRSPAMFNELPSSVSAASYTYGLPAERLAKFRGLVVDLAAGALEAKGAPPKLVQDVEFVLDEALRPPKVRVQAIGAVGLRPDGTLLAPWGLYGTTEPKQSVIELLDRLGRVLSSKYWKKLEPLLDEAISLRPVNEKLRGAPQARVYRYRIQSKLLKEVEELDEAQGLSQGDREDAKRVAAALFQGGYLAVDSLPTGTVIVYSRDKRGLEEALKELRDAKAQTLGSLPETRQRFDQPKVAQGFSELAGLLGYYGIFLPEDLLITGARLLESTPNGGEVPTFFSLAGTLSADKLHFEVEYEVPSAFLGDAAALVGLLAVELGDAR